MASFWEVQKVPGSGDLLDDMMTYVSQPGGLGRHPAVIVAHDFKVYPKVGQRFFSHRPDSFHEHAAEDGWARTLDWFQKYLSPVTTAV